MKRSRYTEEQIIGILKEQPGYRCGAVPQARHERCNVYTWKSKYGGLEVSEAKRLRALEAGNAKLKRLLAARDARQRRAEGAAGKNGDARC